MDKGQFTANLLLLKQIEMALKSEGEISLNVLELSHFLNTNLNPMMTIEYFHQLSRLYTEEIDPMEGLKKRKNIKMLTVLNLYLYSKLKCSEPKAQSSLAVEAFNKNTEAYNEWFNENIKTIGLDRIEQVTLKGKIENLLNIAFLSKNPL